MALFQQNVVGVHGCGERGVSSQVARPSTLEDFDYQARGLQVDSIVNGKPVQKAVHPSDMVL